MRDLIKADHVSSSKGLELCPNWTETRETENGRRNVDLKFNKI